MNSSLNRFFKVIWCKIRLTWVAVSEAANGQGKEKSSTSSASRDGASTAHTAAQNTRALWDGDHLRLVPLAQHLPLSLQRRVRQTLQHALQTLSTPHTLMASAFTSTLASGSALAAPPATNQLPTGGQVSAGQASIGQSGAHMVIQQSTDRAAINWQTFNLGSNAQVQFNQPSAASVTLNRVMSTDPSQIFGRITANGQVILSNPAGVYFGPSARVDVGGILATTHGISDADFMAGSNRFERNGSTGSVVNEGELKAALGGYIALLAPEVRNQGAVIAHMGTVALASGEAVDLSFDSNNRLTSLRVEPSQIQALVDNQHAVQAPGGLVIISAQSMDRLVGGVVKNSGSIEATGLQQQGGRIVLSASTKTENSGTLNVSNAQGLGGSVSLQGEHIELQAGSRIDATGSQGGGTVLVGGNWQGTTDPLLQATGQSTQAATTVTMAATATIDASATDKGDGGKVVLWSDITNADSVTSAHGTIWAKGAGQGGNGGQVETSGHWLRVDGATVNASAAQGQSGAWLLDPQNVTISDTYDDNYNTTDASGTRTYLPNNDVSNVNAGTIANALNSGTSVTVTTGTTGAQLGDLAVNAAISKSSGNNDVTLTLRAANSIVINRNILHAGGSGKLNLVIDADNNNPGTNGGTSPDRNGGGIVILEANLSTGGGSVTFGGTDVNGFNGGDLFVGGASGITIGTSGGAVDVKGNLIIANSSTDGFTINTAGGTINLRRAVDSGNQYSAVFGTRTWQQAFDDARTQPNSWMATIGSSLENALAIRAAGYSSAWLGGQRIIGTNLWQWTADPAYNANTNPMTFFYQGATTQTQLGGASSGTGGTTASGYFANWSGWTNGSTAVSEPNNWNGSGAGVFSQDNESVLQFTGSQGLWNDLPKTFTQDRYVRETNLAPSRLTLNAGTGAVTVGAGIGFSKALSQLNVTSSSTSVTGSGIITTGAQSYSSGLTVENTGRVNISGTTVTTQGPVTVKSSSNDVYLNAAFTNTATTATTFNAEATRHVQLSSNASITSSTAALNTRLWADTNKDGDGIIYFEGSGVDTKGGSLTFGKTGQTTTVGGNTVLVGGDVFFQRSSAQTLTTGGGDLNVYGETIVANTAGLTINSGNGNVSLHGLLNSGNQYTWVDKMGSAGLGSWDEARAEAKNGTNGGSATGDSYLVNITSRLENAIAGLTAGYQGAWIGAYRSNTANHNWVWADGPESGQIFFTQNSTGGGGVATSGYYANFGSGEPNGGLDATRTNVESVGQFFGSAGLWNDLHTTTTYANNAAGSQYAVKGFVRETNLAGSPVTINAGTGSVQIQGGVGTAKALTSLNVTSSATTVKGNGLVTTGAQTYSSALTVNDSSYVQAVNLQAGAGGMTVGGAMTVYGGAFEAIQLNTDITSTASGDLKFMGTASTGWSVRLMTGKTITKSAGTGTLTFAGPGRIDSQGNIQATGTAQLNVVMSAETDNGSTYGVGTGTISTNGGDVWIGGGNLTSTWNGLAVGSGPAAATGVYGNSIDLTGNITTNGGKVMMRAAGTNSIVLDVDHVISTGSGNISLLTDQVSRNGKYLTVDTTGTLTYAPENTAWQGIGGSLNVYGTISNNVWTGGGDTDWLKINSVSSLGGLVLGKDGNASGVSIDSGSPWSIAGPISLYGASIGINANLTSTQTGADILVKSTGSITQAANMGVTTNGGDVTYWADSDADTTNYGQIILNTGSSISTGGGNVTLGGGTDMATGYATYKATGYGNTGDNAANTGAGIDLRDASISAGTGSVTLRGRSVGTADDYSHGISIRGDNANASVTGGAITLTGLSDNISDGSAGSSNRGISLIETGTGSVAITGSGAVSLTGTGSAGTGGTGYNNRGIVLVGASVGSTGGAVALTGTGRSSGGANMGISVQNGQISATGGGITLTGTGSSNATDQYNHGVWLENSTLNGSGAIAVTGTGGATSGSGSDNFSIGLQVASSSITGNGAVTLTGTSGGRSTSTGNNKGLHVIGNSAIRSGVGTLTLTGTGGVGGSSEGIAIEGSSGQTITLGSATAGEQTGNIKLQANTFWFNPASTNQILGTGSATIEPLGASFTNTFTTNGVTLGSSLTGLTLGKNGNTGGVTVANAISIAGPIGIYGGNIAINAGLTSTGTGTNALITLKGSGNVTDGINGYVQSGSDGNGSLLLLGGNVTLDNSANNDVQALAASGVSGLTYLDKAGLTIGSVGSTDGVTATGVVNIGTQLGSLGITQSVTTTNATSNALTLSASMGSAVGSDTSYNILISGTPTISVGTGGTGKLYTGGVDDSTGVTALVGSGSGRFRYNSKLGAHNFTASLGSGLYAIYREQPSLTVTADTQTITYGDSPTLTTSSSGTVKNGDTLAMAVPNLPTATVHDAANTDPTIAAGANSTSYYDADTYTLRVGTLASSALGYALNTATGTLTVNKKAATITADNAAKIYSLNDPSFTVSYTGLAAGETSITDGTRTITRPANEAVGDHVITVAGAVSTGNYTLTYVPGTFTIAPVEKLLVTVGQTTANYGTEAVYTATSAKYVSGSTEIALTLTDATGGASDAFTFTDGANNTITLNIDGLGMRNSSGFFNVGTRGLQALGVVEGIAGITEPGATISGSLNVVPKVLSLSDTKVYDGNRAFSGTISTGVGSETLTYTNAQANSANVANAAYFTAMTLANGSNGGVTSNYSLPNMTQASAGNAANITRRALALSASSVYDGSTSLGSGSIGFTAVGGNANSGLVAGETLGVSAATGSDAHVATANKYISSITLADANGLVGNYSIQGLSPTAGSALTGLSYSSSLNSLSIEARSVVVSLTDTNVSKVYDGTVDAKVGSGANANAVFAPTFAVTNLASGDTFSLTYNAAYNSANVVSANVLNLSNIAISGISGTASSVASDYTLNTTASVAASITARPVAVSGTGVSKVYDGTTGMNQVSIGFIGVSGQTESGVVSGESLTVSGGTGTFSSVGAGTGKSYSLSGFTLSSGVGTLSSNYSMPGGGSSTLTGNDGVIYQRPLTVTFTGDTKVYDGTTAATASVSYANAAYAPVTINSVTDDVVINRTATYDNKNVGSGSSRVSISGVSLGGTDAANYTLSYSAADPLHSSTVGNNAGYNSSASGQITQLSSATWVGGTPGNWFDPANWAATNNLNVTGMVPDLANVATVVIPTGNTVFFNGTGSGLAVANQPVSITGLQGTGATLNVSNGTLNVGANGATLAGLAQTGGAINSTGAFTVSDAFSQTAGTLATTGNGAHVNIHQANGALSWSNISAGGNLTLTGADAVTLGATTVGGNLSSTTDGTGSSGGVTQTGALVVHGTSTFVADTGTLQDAVLTHVGNDFVGAVSFTTANNGSWRDVALTDVNALTLGDINAMGKLDATATTDLTLNGTVNAGSLDLNATNGNITQGNSSTLTVTNGPTNLNAGGNVTLDQANDFNGTVNASGNNVTLHDVNNLTLGDITATGKLDATATTDLTLNGSVNAGSLDLNATNGNITQGNGSTLTVTNGPTNLNAGGNVTLDQANDFNGTVNANGNNVTLHDVNNLTLGDINATGKLDATAMTDLTLNGTVNAGSLDLNATNGNITQGNNSTLTVTNGPTNLNAGGNVTLDQANDFNGTVNANGGNVTLNDVNNLTLGDINATGKLDATATTDLTLNGTVNAGSLDLNATNGNITQGNSSTLTVTNGPTNLNAGGNVTLDQANDFNGTVNANGNNVTLNDANNLTLGAVTANGDLDLGARGNIGQDASSGRGIEVSGKTRIVAQGSVVLDSPNNKFPQGVTVQAASYKIAGDSRKAAGDALAKVAGSMPVGSLQGVGQSNANTPQPLVMSSATTSSSSASPSASGSTETNSSGVTVDLRNTSQPEAPVMVAVSLPKGISTVGTGFSFEMPESVKTMMGTDTALQITQADGSPLPDWLKFNPQSMRFEATAVPNSALPMQLSVAMAGQRVAVVISERTE